MRKIIPIGDSLKILAGSQRRPHINDLILPIPPVDVAVQRVFLFQELEGRGAGKMFELLNEVRLVVVVQVVSDIGKLLVIPGPLF